MSTPEWVRGVFPRTAERLMSEGHGSFLVRDEEPVLVLQTAGRPIRLSVAELVQQLEEVPLVALTTNYDVLLERALADADASASRDDIVEFLRRNAPELSTLWGWVPRTREEIYAFVALLVAVMSLIATLKQGESALTHEEIRELVELTRDEQPARPAPDLSEWPGPFPPLTHTPPSARRR